MDLTLPLQLRYSAEIAANDGHNELADLLSTAADENESLNICCTNKDAEIERLRAEVEQWKRSDQLHAEEAAEWRRRHDDLVEEFQRQSDSGLTDSED